MQPIDSMIEAATEGTRARHFWDARRAAKLLSLHPNRITSWWLSVETRLTELAIDQPSETAAMLGLILARAQAERQRIQKKRAG